MNDTIVNWDSVNPINISINELSKFTIPNQKIDILQVYKSICGQLGSYFVRTGIILICLYIFFSWFNWWFFNKGYKKIDYDKTSKVGKYIGDLNNIETRIYWDVWIKNKLSKLLIGYIFIVIYFNW